jgi:type IV fimbrial biogenesis protein FimT
MTRRPPDACTPRRQRGFTIVELMIVVAILGVLAAIGIPAFQDMTRNNRRATVVNELLANLMLARAEAAKRGQPVTVCGYTSGGGTNCTGAGVWDYGWMVFVDVNGNGSIESSVSSGGVTYDETAMVLRRYVSDFGNEVKVRSNTGGVTNGFLVIRPFSQPSTTTLLTVCDKRGAAEARAVIVEGSGRAHSSSKDAAGNALACP